MGQKALKGEFVAPKRCFGGDNGAEKVERRERLFLRLAGLNIQNLQAEYLVLIEICVEIKM